MSFKLVIALKVIMFTSCLYAQSLNDMFGASRAAPSTANQPPPTAPRHNPVTLPPSSFPLPSSAPSLIAEDNQVEDQVLEEREAVDILQTHLSEHYPDQDMSVNLSKAPFKYKCAPQAALAKPTVGKLQFNSNRTHFKAWLQVCEKAPSLLIQGRIDSLVSIPALARPVPIGSTISEDNIISLQIPQSRVVGSMIMQVSDLLGAKPKNGLLKAGVPLLRRDLMRPFQIEKGSIITITYIKPKIVLMAKGKALENGRTGDLIQVQNIDSNKTIKAIVEGSGHVFIQALPSLD